MAKFIQNGTLRTSVGDIAAYWENYEADNGLLVMLLKSGDRIAYVLDKESIKRMAEYLDNQNQIVTFEGAGTWQHVGRLSQELPEKVTTYKNPEGESPETPPVEDAPE